MPHTVTPLLLLPFHDRTSSSSLQRRQLPARPADAAQGARGAAALPVRAARNVLGDVADHDPRLQGEHGANVRVDARGPRGEDLRRGTRRLPPECQQLLLHVTIRCHSACVYPA